MEGVKQAYAALAAVAFTGWAAPVKVFVKSV